MSEELHYLTYDAEEIYKEMQMAYVEAGGDILYPGDEKEMLLRAVQAILVQSFAGIDNALRMRTLRYAVGEYLDLYGETRGCERITAQKAETTVQITFGASGVSKTIAAGAKLTADGSNIWVTKEAITQSGIAQTVIVGIEASEAGSEGNALKQNMTMQFCSPNNAVVSIVVKSDASGGNDAEEDDVYRERIRLYGLQSVTTGPSAAYEADAMEASSDIIDAKAVRTAAGQVTVYLITKSGADDTAIIAAVKEKLNDKTRRPLTDLLTVSKATDVAYTLNVVYTAEVGSGISDAAAEAVKNYQEWQDETIGQPFNPDRLMAALYTAGATRVQWGTGSKFNGGSVTYTEITSGQRCKGTITLTQS